jgi:hypothetical protein
MANLGLIALGAVGGALPDIIRITKGMHDPAIPTYLKSMNFYLGFVLLMGLGCLAAWLGQASAPKEALAYGYGAPELISRLLSNAGAARSLLSVRSIRQWWAV